MSCGTMGCSRSMFIDHLDLSLGVYLAHQTMLRYLSQEPSSKWVMRCTHMASWPLDVLTGLLGEPLFSDRPENLR